MLSFSTLTNFYGKQPSNMNLSVAQGYFTENYSSTTKYSRNDLNAVILEAGSRYFIQVYKNKSKQRTEN